MDKRTNWHYSIENIWEDSVSITVHERAYWQNRQVIIDWWDLETILDCAFIWWNTKWLPYTNPIEALLPKI